ncbi:hypothetical protein CERZMDRAFT_81896 [Cercospora zeae-maydis SCOH1-5]|uniref:Uncharacterized protein n=1 Tax=Cercospora zeae-maydis SCOH1-5 TaxID=717836 RepID=A0A6A6FQN2_9PEZI|nr:hypothetical protein CERZMDRAFT_81896 [Cercospora zeae-maydis SCOH1-5]
MWSPIRLGLLPLLTVVHVEAVFRRGYSPYFEADLAQQHPALAVRADPQPVVQKTFDQLIDHSNPALGTFKQRYWYSTEFWKGEGSPVVVFYGGSDDASEFDFWVNSDYAIPGLIAERVGAAVVLVEQRFLGSSLPYSELTTANLEYLTVDQTLLDLPYFAHNVELPFASKNATSPEVVPWVNFGCSADGAYALYTERLAPGTFWATYSSSASAQAIENFWHYFDAAKTVMAKNCSADVERVVDYLDNIMIHGTQDEFVAIKDKFGAPGLQDKADFMNLINYGPQSYQQASARTHDLWNFCDYIEGVQDRSNTSTEPLPGAEGVGLQQATEGYARWTRDVWIPGRCNQLGPFPGENNTDCFALTDPSNKIFSNLSAVVNFYPGDRYDMWLWCNEASQWWQTGSPEGTPTLVSRLVNVDYFRAQCPKFFPAGPNGETFGIAKGKTADQFNAKYGGWDDPTPEMKRLVIISGQNDAWRAAGFHSDQRPQGHLQDGVDVRSFVTPKANHCTDIYKNAAQIWPEVKVIQDEAVDQIVKWVSEFKAP